MDPKPDDEGMATHEQGDFRSSPSTSSSRAIVSPPAHVVELAVEVSGWSPCRSKRGVVLFRGDDILGHGYNYKPKGFACDGSEACKATCRVEAVHAEQQALLSVGRKADGADILHVKTVGGQLVSSGGPSCVQCSKLALACGVAWVWLYHADGWRRCDADEFHRRSIEASHASEGAALTSLQEAHDRLQAERDRIQAEFADTFADRDGNLYEQVKDLVDQFYIEREERDQLKGRE